MKLLYQAFFWVLPGILNALALFSPKIRHFLKGREGLFQSLANFRKDHPGKLVWVHVASLGEYEQAKPLIAKWKEAKPGDLIAISFFSPSGYDPAIKKPQPNVDFITYIPLDRKSWAEEFVRILQPELTFFVKYDLWFFHIQALKKRNIPTYLIASSFRPNQIYFAWYGGVFRKILSDLNWIFTQNEESISLLKRHGITHASRAGDTRFDRVSATATAPKQLKDIEEWVNNEPTIVIGSAWDEDMSLLIPLINSNSGYKWIIAPHDLDPWPMKKWADQVQLESKKYSEWNSKETNLVLFIDNIGMLSSLYQFAKIAYVGGAFGKGLHNILEPLGFGIPVIFGKVKKLGKFPESVQSQKEGCGFEVSNSQELQQIFEKLNQDDFYEKSASSAQKWVKSNLGAADRIISHILSHPQES